MAEVWGQAVDALRSFYDRVVEAFSGVNADPATWTVEVYVLAGLVLLVLLLLVAVGRRGERKRAGPQFLLTNGQVVLVTDAESVAPADGGPRKPAFLTAPEGADFQLRVTFNNLNSYPVQLLEIALTTGAGRVPVVADASAVVPPNGAVDVVAEVHELPGDRGTLQAFVFATRARPQNLKITVPLEWEPWNLRYRVRATQQRVEPARGVASERVIRMERGAARRSAVRERMAAAASGLSRWASDAWESAAERRKAAAAARRARAQAAAEERAARAAAVEEPTGPISVPLTPSRRYVEEVPAEAEDRPLHDVEDAEETRPADAVDVGEPREREEPTDAPRRRLEFPDDF